MLVEHIILGDNPDMHILLADDSEGDIILITESFKDSNTPCHLYVVHDGEQALDFVQDAQNPTPDLIIMDINMPRMKGSEALETLKQQDETKTIPVVMFTSSDMESDIEAVKQMGANGYVKKQGLYDLEAFIDVMHQANANPDQFYSVEAA